MPASFAGTDTGASLIAEGTLIATGLLPPRSLARQMLALLPAPMHSAWSAKSRSYCSSGRAARWPLPGTQPRNAAQLHACSAMLVMTSRSRAVATGSGMRLRWMSKGCTSACTHLGMIIENGQQVPTNCCALRVLLTFNLHLDDASVRAAGGCNGRATTTHLEGMRFRSVPIVLGVRGPASSTNTGQQVAFEAPEASSDLGTPSSMPSLQAHNKSHAHCVHQGTLNGRTACKYNSKQ